MSTSKGAVMDEHRVPVDEAMSRLDVIPDYDAGAGPGPCVHTFAQSPVALLGAHWYLPDVQAFFERWGVEESGSQATASGHGLVAIDRDDNRVIFFATRPDVRSRLDDASTESHGNLGRE